ncbi:uncharacterized protein [Lepisosteus oculatus]|uniref:uncharacterized protein n=1 Tax=Lepisosteus oculatus TaxID=7918 RepID=UPI0035F52EC2
MEAQTLLLLPCAAVWAVVSGAVSLGDTVTLPCDLELQHETTWFLQRNETLALRILASKNHVEQQTEPFDYKNRPDSRFSLVLNPSTNSSSLRIEGVTETDQGLYYCATRDRGEIHIGKGTRLRLHGGAPEQLNNTSENATCRTEPHRECCTLLVWVPPVCALLSALVSSACVCCLCHRKGARHTTDPPQSRRSRRGEQDRQQDEETEVQYATLDIRAAPNRSRRSPVQSPESCTYSDIGRARTGQAGKRTTARLGY